MQTFFEAGSWAKVILFSGFFTKAIVLGLAFSFGLYTDEFSKYFDTSAANASLAIAVNLGVFRMAGPFVSLLLKKVSCRTMAVIGGLLSCVGTLSVVFTRDIPSICVSYGVIAGVGFCICELVSSVMFAAYFKKNRAIANAIIHSGAAFGASSIPFITNRIIEEYTWRGSFYITSCLTAQLIVLGALLRTPQIRLLKRTAIDGPNKTHNDQPIEGRPVRNSTTPENIELVSPVFSASRNMEITTNIDDNTNKALGQRFYNHAVCRHIHRDESDLITTNDQLPTEQKTLRKLSPSSEQVSKEVHLGFKQTKHKVLGNLGFLLFTLSWFLFAITMGALANFLPKFVLSVGLTTSDAARFMALRNVACFVFIILSGFLMNSKNINAIVLYAIANTAFGVQLIFFNYFHSYHIILAIIIACGAATGVIYCAKVVIILDLVGTEHTADGIGFNLFATGLGFLTGAFVAGYLYDVTNGFDAMYYCLCAVQCVSGFIMACYVIHKTCSSVKWSVNRS